MKSKIIAALLTATFASVVSAQVLYWQVNPSVSIVNGDTSTAGTTWNYASFWAVKDGTASLVNSYMFNSGSAPTEVSYVDTDYLSGSAPAYVNYSSDNYTGYSFYIELTNCTDDGNDVGVARSNSFTSDNFGNALQDAANFNANWSSINAIGSGLTFTAIPEPTSGLMLLVGAAILGLRRKRQQI